MIKAYPDKNGSLFYLRTDRSSEIFYKKDKIKELGGKWFAGAWHVQEKVLKQIGAVKMIQVKHAAFCHEQEGLDWATEAEVIEGEKGGMFCGFCDSRHNLKVKIWRI